MIRTALGLVRRRGSRVVCLPDDSAAALAAAAFVGHGRGVVRGVSLSPSPFASPLSPPSATRSISTLLHRALMPGNKDDDKDDDDDGNRSDCRRLDPLDVDTAAATVRLYDPSGYLPGLLLPTPEARIGYYAVRSFWIETGLRRRPLPDFGVATREESEGGGNVTAAGEYGDGDVDDDEDKEGIEGIEGAATEVSVGGKGGGGGYYSSSQQQQQQQRRKEEERLRRWRVGIESVFRSGSAATTNTSRHAGNDDDDGGNDANEPWAQSPTLRLLRYVVESRKCPLSEQHFHSILEARRHDLRVDQYDSVDELIEHSDRSCGSLLRLVLECCDVAVDVERENENENEENDVGQGKVGSSNATARTSSSTQSAIRAIARDIGVCHGITNALRTSIPVLSNTGKIIIPADLCRKHGVRTPRYLLSALAMGDDKCKGALKLAVSDLVSVARGRLDQARNQGRSSNLFGKNRGDIGGINGDNGDFSSPSSRKIINNKQERAWKQKIRAARAAFLPGLACEAFLDRLERSEYDLTDRSLRIVGYGEHVRCASNMIIAKWKGEY